MPELGPISYSTLLLGSDTLEDCDKNNLLPMMTLFLILQLQHRQLLIHPQLKIRKRQKSPKNCLLNGVKTELVLCGQHLIGLKV